MAAVPDTIPGADTRDVSAELQAWIDAQPDGSELYFPKMYRFDAAGPILRYRKNLRLFGPGGFTTPTDGFDVPKTPGFEHLWPRARFRLQIDGCDDIAVQGLTLEGSNKANTALKGYVESLEGQHGVNIRGSKGVTIGNKDGETDQGVTVRYVRGDYIYLGGGKQLDGTRRWSENVAVRGNLLTHNGRQGFGITSARDVLIENNVTDYCRRTLIDIEPNSETGGVQRLTFRDNDFRQHYLTFFTIHRYGILEDITMEGCKASRPNFITPAPDNPEKPASRIKRVKMLNNVSQPPGNVGNPQGCAWRVSGIDGFEVRGNKIRVQGKRNMHLLCMQDCTGVAIGDGNEAINGVGIVSPTSVYTG
jgi:hypothetical protein